MTWFMEYSLILFLYITVFNLLFVILFLLSKRVVKVVPSKVLHIVGNHDGFMVEQLGYSQDKSLLASVGQDNFIKFWDVSVHSNERLV
jgi:WD40 repeat protein